VLAPLAKDQVAAPATEVYISAAVPYFALCVHDNGYPLSSVLVYRVIQQFLITIGDCGPSTATLSVYGYIRLYVCGK